MKYLFGSCVTKFQNLFSHFGLSTNKIWHHGFIAQQTGHIYFHAPRNFVICFDKKYPPSLKVGFCTILMQ